MAGFVRFGLFVAIIALGALGFYAKALHNTVTEQRATINALTIERDAFRDQLGSAQKLASDSASEIKNAESRIQSLQTELEEIKKAPRPRRR